MGLSLNCFAIEDVDNTNIEEQNNESNNQNDNNNQNNVNNNSENNNENNNTNTQEKPSNPEQKPEEQQPNNNNVPEVIPSNNESTSNDNWQETTPTVYIPSNDNRSENADLKSLSINLEGMLPEFDKNITEYYLVVSLEVTEINVDAQAEDDNASVTIKGNTDLIEGENEIQIIVRAERGNTKSYIIYVTRTDNYDFWNTNLKSLSVKGFNFYPNFKPNIHNYNLIINEKISQLDISTEVEIEGATYEIVGNENLKNGDNLIKIIVTAKNGETKREYKINAYISSEPVEIKPINRSRGYMLLTIIGIAIIASLVPIIKNKFTN